MTLIEVLALTQVICTRYILMICYVLGIIGCFLNIIIFCQKKLRSNSCSIYFTATSIFNLLVILFGITPVFLSSYLPNDPSSYSSVFCKARSYTTHVFLMMSRSSVALACIDRFALCSRNVHIRSLNQCRIAIILLIIITIIWLIVPIHLIIYVDIQIPKHCGASGLYQIIYSVYASLVTSIPLITMIIFSILAIQSLQYTRARVHPVTRIAVENKNTPLIIHKRDIQLMTILISEVIVYFLSTVWYPLNTIYTTITSNTSKTPNRTAVEGFIRYLALSFFIFINSCSLFYVHLLASKAFRQEFKQLVLRLFKRDQNNRGFQAPSDIPLNRRQINPIYHRQQIDTTLNNIQ